MIFQLVWTTASEIAFEQKVPLKWHGEFILKNGWENNIKIGFLEGMNLLSKSYLKELECLGYELVDCQPLVARLSKDYPELKRYDTTNKYWYLRWNVLEQLTCDRGGAFDTVIHLDADVVLMADPNELYRDVRGKTFVLEGCPVFTAISCKEWFRAWQNELADFLANPDSYLNEALSIKEQPIKQPREYCNSLYYGPGRFHDQDMLEYLISAGKLPQERTSEVFNSRYFWMQNPINPGEWFDEQFLDTDRLISEQGNGATVGDKKVAFYHFQMNFARYSLQWMQLHKIGMEQLAPKVRGNPENNYLPLLGIIIARAIKYLNWQKDKNRQDIYDMVFKKNPHTGNLYITDIVNSCW